MRCWRPGRLRTPGTGPDPIVELDPITTQDCDHRHVFRRRSARNGRDARYQSRKDGRTQAGMPASARFAAMARRCAVVSGRRGRSRLPNVAPRLELHGWQHCDLCVGAQAIVDGQCRVGSGSFDVAAASDAARGMRAARPGKYQITGAGRPASTARAPVHRGRLGGGGGPLAAAARHAPRRVELALTRGGGVLPASLPGRPKTSS